MFKDMKKSLKRYFSAGPKTTFVVVLLTMGMTLTLYSMRKTLTISIDGNEMKVVTYRSDLKSALQRNDIEVGPKDKIEPGIDSKVKNGQKISIRRAVAVDVSVDGQDKKIATAESDVEDMLQMEGIAVSDFDKVEPSKTEAIKDGMKVIITRVQSEVVKETQPIDFSTAYQKDDSFEKTITKIAQEGEPGEREIATRVVYENGKEVSRQMISNIVKKQPVQRVLVQGTLGVLNLSRGGGEKVLYKTSIRVKATAYSSEDPGVGRHTASGTGTIRNSNGYSTIAVDPNIIPLGTRVYVEGYGFAIAEDTGGAIKGNTIDVFVNSASEAYNWGVRYLNVYILK